jgi:hypothetical protein
MSTIWYRVHLHKISAMLRTSSEIGSLIGNLFVIHKEAALISVSDIFGDNEESFTLTDEELNMIIDVDAKIDHKRFVNTLKCCRSNGILSRGVTFRQAFCGCGTSYPQP